MKNIRRKGQIIPLFCCQIMLCRYVSPDCEPQEETMDFPPPTQPFQRNRGICQLHWPYLQNGASCKRMTRCCTFMIVERGQLILFSTTRDIMLSLYASNWRLNTRLEVPRSEILATIVDTSCLTLCSSNETYLKLMLKGHIINLEMSTSRCLHSHFRPRQGLVNKFSFRVMSPGTIENV